jgi:hypothetical protein
MRLLMGWREVCGAAVATVVVASLAGAATAAEPTTPPTSAPAAATVTPATSVPAPTAESNPTAGSAAPAGPAALAAVVSEIRSSVAQITALRKSAAQSGDKVKESCLYDRLRSLAQTLDSAQIAHAGYESATARGESDKARSEQARAQKALELAHKLRSDAENCVGNELRTGPRATTVTVTSSGASDDPLAGPSEQWTVRPARLEIPSRPNPASAFHPPR